ncbi:TonB-dependent siderophore receptor, partial [Acinetobacter baumannii]
GEVWRRANSRITDTNTFTDQLALTGKFNTGTIKHSFNVGAEYSDQESDKGSYTVTSKSGKPITGSPKAGACSLGIG